MDELLYLLNVEDLEVLTNYDKSKALNALEEGKVIFLPSYSFSLQNNEKALVLCDKILDGKHKNVSYDCRKQKLGGLRQDEALASTLKPFMHRYAEFAKELLVRLMPQYRNDLHWGRTSYRPAEVKGRQKSKRKDDSRLHVDSFPATPVNGRRILRVFSNVNPHNEPRIWHLGEPFTEVLKRFAPTIKNYSAIRAKLLHLIKATKMQRSAYDHYQLHLHDGMKLSDSYQQSTAKKLVEFPSQSSWIVFTDQVSHAALGGQFLLEQTFYLPVEAMSKPELSPLRLWEKEKQAILV
ncbi:MAG: Kdo hydroxylase family protein [Tatlockia sp.]|nr:Kdo hydroxylase family protein [Tatlockia sp.]